MKVLFLDDESWRWDTFSKAFPDAYWARTADQANRAIDTERFDLICLDHDLGNPQNGMKVVEHLIAKAEPIEHVWIHSWNSPAASSMHLALYRAGIVRDLSRDIFSREAVFQLLSRLVSGS